MSDTWQYGANTDGASDGEPEQAPSPQSAEDGQPGLPLAGVPGWRVGAFGSGGGLLGVIRVSNPVSAPTRAEPVIAPPGLSGDQLVGQTKWEKILSEAAALGSIGPIALGNLAKPYIDWVSRVAPGGSWDFKKTDPKYEGFGNYNYMRTGHEGLGLDEDALRRAAGALQELQKHSTPQWGNFWQGPPYGDDPADQAAMPTYGWRPPPAN